jgi:hypothetical protein
MLPEIFIIAENPQVTVSKRNSLQSLKVEEKITAGNMASLLQ